MDLEDTDTKTSEYPTRNFKICLGINLYRIEMKYNFAFFDR